MPIYKTSDVKNPNVTVVGSPTVVNGVVSGFSSSNYLTLPKSFDVSDGSSWEMVWKITTPSSFSKAGCIIGRNVTSAWASRIQVSEIGNINFVLSNDSNGWLVNLSGTSEFLLKTNTSYLIKVEYKNGLYAIYRSENTNEPNWFLGGTQEASVYTQTDLTRIGEVSDSGSDNSFPFLGSIDLNESYIKINGSLWWSGTVYVAEKVKDIYRGSIKISKVYKGSTLVYTSYPYEDNQLLFEKSTAGTYTLNIEATGVYDLAVVGGGGAAAMRGVYDDKGYGWTGGSGGAFVGSILIPKGTYTVTVGKANNNTTAQSGNSQTLNPTDTKTYGSSIAGVVSVGGGGSGHYNSSYVGAAGAAPTFTIQPLASTVNRAGNAGVSGSGGKGGGAGATINGGASVYNGYGKGQGCVTSEYAAKRSWINGTAGYVKVTHRRKPIKYTFTINPTPSNATVTIDGVATNSVSVYEGSTVSYSVSASGYVTKTGSVKVTSNTTQSVALVAQYTFTINPTPSNATVTINGSTRKTITVASGTSISWSVSASGYTAQSGSLTLTANTTKNVVLEEIKEPLYYCYRCIDQGTTYWVYAKTPIGSDTAAYFKYGIGLQATSASELQSAATAYSMYLSNMSASQVTYHMEYGIVLTCTRYTAGDLYS